MQTGITTISKETSELQNQFAAVSDRISAMATQTCGTFTTLSQSAAAVEQKPNSS
jgi:hypothetical protein